MEELRSEGVEMTAEQVCHLSPMDWEHIGLTGDYTWDFILEQTCPELSIQNLGLLRLRKRRAYKKHDEIC